MKSLVLVIFLLDLFVVIAQNDGIILKNEVYFSTYVEYGTTDTVPTIEFKIIVTNKTEENIPDLGVTNRSKYLNFYINHKKNNPLSLYNGAELVKSKKIIEPGNSDEYVFFWILSKDSGIKVHGNTFSIHWQYLGFFSKKVEVKLAERKIRTLD